MKAIPLLSFAFFSKIISVDVNVPAFAEIAITAQHKVNKNFFMKPLFFSHHRTEVHQ
jgi:hypothetical protein